ncbi:MAG: hypothetical protein WCF08_01665 [Anaerolineaceae bacterium]
MTIVDPQLTSSLSAKTFGRKVCQVSGFTTGLPVHVGLNPDTPAYHRPDGED